MVNLITSKASTVSVRKLRTCKCKDYQQLVMTYLKKINKKEEVLVSNKTRRKNNKMMNSAQMIN